MSIFQAFLTRQMAVLAKPRGTLGGAVYEFTA